MKKRIFFSGLLLVFLTLFAVTGYAQTITIGSVIGSQGDSVTIPIFFTNHDNNVCALQFDILFDSSLIKFTGATKGSLIQDFDFSANETEKGRLTIILFRVAVPLPPIPDGELAQLNMKIRALFAEAPLKIDEETLVMSDTTGTEEIPPESSNNGTITHPMVPSAVAGENQTIYEGEQVMLDGSGSFNQGGETLSYQWKQISGTEVTLSDPAAMQPTFTAPEVDINGESLLFELTVKSSVGFEDTDTVTIMVEDVTPVISLSSSSEYVSETDDTFTFNIVNTGTGIMEWHVSTDAEWLSISPRQGTESGTITVTYHSNPGEIRIGKITVTGLKAVNSPQVFEVIQKRADWIRMETKTSAHLRGIWGSSENDIFAVGKNGTILHYDSNIWTKMETGSSAYLRSVWGSSGNNVFAVGYAGTILHYDGNPDGLWKKMESSTLINLNGIWGSSGNNVFAVGDQGTILHYDGISWTKMLTSTFNPLYDIWGDSRNNFFTVGGIWNSITMLHYDGNLWREIPVNASDIPYGIWGASASSLFLVGNSGMILHYNGAESEKMRTNTMDYLRGVWGSSENERFAVGMGGTVLCYDGNTWKEMTTGASADLFGIWGSSEKNIFAVGNSGTILRHGSADLSVTPLSRDVPASGGTTTFDVLNTGAGIMKWQATSDVPWLTIDKNGWQTDSSTLTVSYEINPGDMRTGSITITAPGALNSSQAIQIKQGITMLAGDTDGSGIIDLRDAIQILKLLARMNPSDIHVRADTNGDGKLGIEDVIYILRQITEQNS